MKQAQQAEEAGNPDPEVREGSPGTGPGGHLAVAREARGLTLALVAKNLRLSAATLQALESSRYEDLPEPIYVRGYLRAYARLLEMDEEVLVAEYDRTVDRREPVLRPTTRVRRQATAPGLHIRGAAALVVVTIAVLLGSWGYSRLNQDIPAQSRTASLEGEQPVSPASVRLPPQNELRDPDAEPALAPMPDFPAELPASEAAAGEAIDAVESEPPMSEDAAEPALSLVSGSPVTANAEAVVQSRGMQATMAPAVPDLPIAPLASERGRLV
ncbi:MAG TPA: helix-turn-helix domain-containing protein, partial [Gammaproteobacteria bacterium]|nr:helix-turn-helix domain-containing protein [Gammaproteobacteria bacterium]